MLFVIVSTNARCPPRPAQLVPTNVTLGDVLPTGVAANTPITGNTVPVFVLGQFPPLFTLPPVPVYHRRLFGLNFSTSFDVGNGWNDTIVRVVRFRTASPFRLPRQPISIRFVTGSISLPCGPQAAIVGIDPEPPAVSVATMSPVPADPAVGSITSRPTVGIAM